MTLACLTRAILGGFLVLGGWLVWTVGPVAAAPGRGSQPAAAAADLTTAADTGFVFGADLGSGASWVYAEGPAPEGADGAAMTDQGVPGDAGTDGQPAPGNAEMMQGDAETSAALPVQEDSPWLVHGGASPEVESLTVPPDLAVPLGADDEQDVAP